MFRSQVGGKWLDLAAVVGHPKISQNVGCGGGSMSGWVSLYIFTYYMHLFAWKIHGPFCPLLLNCGVLMESGYWCSSHQLMQEFSPSVRMNYDGTKSQQRRFSMMSYVLKRSKLIYTFFGMIIILVSFHLTHKKNIDCSYLVGLSRREWPWLAGCLQPRVKGDKW